MKLQPYGLAFTKVIARRLGVNPIWYVDMTPSGHEWLARPIKQLKASKSLAAIANGLNADCILTAEDGRRWYPATIRHTLNRTN